MRTQYPVAALTLPMIIASILSACGEPTVRGCPVEDASDGLHNLQTQMVLPSDCPVSLSRIGEVKYTGARVLDPNHYMNDGRTTVTNSANELEMRVDAKYQEDVFDGWSIIMEAYYPAATGFYSNWPNYGEQLSGSADDYGLFQSGPYSGWWEAYARVQITYKRSAALASVSGPDVPLSNTSGTWTAGASGGTAPYTYAWYRNGQLVSNGSSYSASTGSAEFGLRLEVTDQTWSVATKDFWVDVDGIRASLSGPRIVYSSEGGGTWTVTGRGGYTPYVYNWSWEGADGTTVNLGSGASYSGYPAEGDGVLYVTMTDAHGRTNSQSISVLGIGNPYEQGGCEPVPPAFTCDP
jgi:hypothetical protein